MLLSFNIPTYNRATFLTTTISRIVDQICELNLENEVEINVSDNASTDETRGVVEKIVADNPQIRITYKCNEHNVGPDINFISAMNMASGKYSILWGDDDFLKEKGLKRILSLIEIGEKRSVGILVSSTSVINTKGDFLYEKRILRNDINEIMVDFSDIHRVREYFFLLRDMAGLLSFITAVVYKTSIIHEIPYDETFTGTHYAFLSYWWGWLAKGELLYCSNVPYVDASEQYQAAYGFGVVREMVDYKGFQVIANTVLKDVPYRSDFQNAFVNLHHVLYRQLLCIREKQSYFRELIDAQKGFGVTEEEQKIIIRSSTLSFTLKNLIFLLLPNKVIMWLKQKKKR